MATRGGACAPRDRPTLERRSGAWLRDFHAAAKLPGFTIAQHLARLADQQ